MRAHNDCLPCFLQQTLSAVRRFGGSAEQEEQALRCVLGWLQRADYGQPPPVVAQQVYGCISDVLGSDDPYRALKAQSNELALRMLPRLRRRVEAASDPLAEALRLALAGNIIDFGAGHRLADLQQALEHTVQQVLQHGPALDHSDRLRRRLDAGGQLLYLLDNAGEIVFDALLMEQLRRWVTVTAVVRGGPIINDVTREDARQAGLEALGVRVVVPTVTLPGMALERSGAELQRLFAEADLILAKGQGNFESLHGAEVSRGRPLFFLFMVKCELVARETGLALGQAVLASESALLDR